MSLRAVFDAAKAVIDAELKGDGDALPFHELGEEWLDRPRSLPSLVWVPVGGPIVPPRQAGATGAVKAGAAIALQNVSNPRHLWTREESIKLVMTSGGIDETEELVAAVVRVMREHLTTWSFRPKDWAWSTGWPGKTEELSAEFRTATCCVLTFVVDIPLADKKMKTAQATSATINPQVVHP